MLFNGNKILKKRKRKPTVKMKDVTPSKLDIVRKLQNEIYAKVKGKTKARKLTVVELRKHMRKDGLLSSWDDTAHLEKKLRQALNEKYKAAKLKSAQPASHDKLHKESVKKVQEKYSSKGKKPDAQKTNPKPASHKQPTGRFDKFVDEVVNTAKSKHGRIGLGIGAGAVGIASYLNRDKGE